MMDSIVGVPPRNASAHQRPPSSSPLLGREDCWNEDATFTLIDAWGERHLDLNRGNLRQKHWQDVAEAVNDCHAAGNNNKKAQRTDVQCKNRIDTLKKKYKIEKARVSDSDGEYVSPWPFFSRLDALIGDTFPVKKLSPPAAKRSTTAIVKHQPPPAWTTSHPVGPRSGTQKRPAPSPANRDDASFRRNFSAFAAAAAAAAEAESGESEEWRPSSGMVNGKKGMESNKNLELGYSEVAQAIERFGEIYERVEAAKQRQIVELEKQRMQFAKDLEYQRMQLFMETQLQLQKMKRTKRSSGADSFS